MGYSFKDFVGNGFTLSLVERMLKNQTFPALTQFNGIFGTGKSSVAKLVAMRLTCEHPNGAEPCCKCAMCRSNMRAFETTGESSCVKVVNMGKVTERTEVNQIIKDVFGLRSSTGATVYVFEEMHALKQLRGAQTALLEEIDRMPPNVYVIMCTTRGFDIIPELTSRAVIFNFKKLTTVESYALVEKEAPDLGKGVANIIVKNTKGVPRLILNSIAFVRDNGITLDEYKEYVQEVSQEQLCLIFASMEEINMGNFITLCENLLAEREPVVVLKTLKEMLVNLLFKQNGAVVDVPVASDMVKGLQEERSIRKFLEIIDGCSETLSNTDMLYVFYRMRLVARNNTVTDVFADSARTAAVVRQQVREEKATKPVLEQKSVLQPLDVTKLRSF